MPREGVWQPGLKETDKKLAKQLAASHPMEPTEAQMIRAALKHLKTCPNRNELAVEA